MKVEASQGGRRIKGPDEPLRTIDLPVKVRECESTIPCGFRQDFGTVEIGDETLSLSSGAGCGSPWITITYKGRDFTIDIRDVATSLLAAEFGEEIELT